MKLKGICLIAAAVLSIGTASLAKDKGHLDQVSQLGCHHRAERYIHAEGDAAHADGGGYPK